MIALKTAENLRRAEHEVSLTRQTDVGLAPLSLTGERRRNADLSARANLANKWGAELFLSIHCNSAAATEAKGIEVFHCDDPGLAATLLRYLLAFTGATDRGVKMPPPTSDPKDDPATLAHWPVLHDPACPAVLVECGFVSNVGELALLSSPAYQVRLGCALAAGIMEFARVTEGR